MKMAKTKQSSRKFKSVGAEPEAEAEEATYGLGLRMHQNACIVQNTTISQPESLNGVWDFSGSGLVGLCDLSTHYFLYRNHLILFCILYLAADHARCHKR